MWVAPIQALRVPNGCSTVARRTRMLFGARSNRSWHGVDYGLMLPALDPALLVGRALGFRRTLGALARPVAVQGHSLLRRREAPGQPLGGRTAIGVLFRDVDEVLFAEPARSLGS